MALAIGNRVSPSQGNPANVPATLPPVTGPLFGIIVSGTDPWNVLWNNGVHDTSLAGTGIDQITAGDSTLKDQFEGKRVQIVSPDNQSTWAYSLCIAIYKRNPAGTGTAVDYALLQNTNSGAFQEVLAANIAVV